MNQEIITKLIEAILTVITILITAYVIPYLKSKIGTDKYEQLKQFTEAAVRAAEQIYTPEEWKLKKDYVVKLISERADTLGIGLNEAEIDALIEGIVNYVKHNKAVE